MKQLYYYETFISEFKDEVEGYISEFEFYIGEEGLMNLIENEIGYIDTLEDLKQYSIEYGYDYNELLNRFNKEEVK